MKYKRNPCLIRLWTRSGLTGLPSDPTWFLPNVSTGIVTLVIAGTTVGFHIPLNILFHCSSSSCVCDGPLGECSPRFIRYPRRRFLVAGVHDGAALVAVERGGIGWNVQVTLYENVAHEPFVSETWALFESPQGLRALCDRVRRGKGERYQLRIEQKKQP